MTRTVHSLCVDLLLYDTVCVCCVCVCVCVCVCMHVYRCDNVYTSECKALSGEPEEAPRSDCFSDACIKQ